MNCSLPGSSVHGIFQARILEWVVISFSRGSSQPRDQTRVSLLQADALASEPPGKWLTSHYFIINNENIMKTSFFTEAAFLGLGVLEFDYLERLQKNSFPFTNSIYKVFGLRTHSGASAAVAIPAVPSTGPYPQQGPALYLHSACMVWSGKAPRLPVGALGCFGLETDSSPQGCTCWSPCFLATGSKELEPLNYC